MSAMAYQITSLLEKMSSNDKDYRFMATNDLMVELQNDSIKLDEETERKVVRMLLKLLEDKNGEVQNLAIKCLGPLINKVKESQAEAIVDNLCTNMISGNEQLRDVSSVALKTVIAELSPSEALSTNVIVRVVPKLTGALSKVAPTEASVRLEILEIIADVLLRYGPALMTFLSPLQEVIMAQLFSDRQALRKRSVVALGNLLIAAPKGLYANTMGTLINQLSRDKVPLLHVRTLVQTTQYICKCTGNRFSPYLQQLVPVILRYTLECNDDELQESCIQAFDSFLYRCPKDMSVYVPKIVELVSNLLKHDPNYTYDEEDDNLDEQKEMDVDEAESDQDDDGDEYSDDDDMSWKVRRASAKCIEALIASRREQIVEFSETLGSLLISRFKEREDNVKWDIFHAFTQLLCQIRNLFPNFSSLCLSDEEKESSLSRYKEGDIILVNGAVLLKSAVSDEQLSVLKILDHQIPALVRIINKQLKTKVVKTKQCCFILLTQLLRAYPGCLANHLHLLVAGVQAAMTDKTSNTNLKIDTLTFLSIALCTHAPEKIHPYMSVLVPLIVQAVKDPFYKVSAGALDVTLALIRVLRPSRPSATFLDSSTFVGSIYLAVAEKLKANDIDQEVKEKAITSIGLLIATFGDYLHDELRLCLPILLERLRNEMTRLVTVKSLTTIVNSPLKINLEAILPDTLLLLAEFLRKNQRALKIATLNLLDSLVNKYTHGGLDSNELEKVLAETPGLISELDLQISQLVLHFLTGVIKVFPKVIGESLSSILNAFVTLTQSSLLQGATLNAALEFLDTLINSSLPDKPSFEKLMSQLTLPVYERPGLHRQAYHSISACAAVVASSAELDKAASLVSTLADHLKDSSTSNEICLFSLLVLGELGRKRPEVYDAVKSIKPELLLMEAFNSSSEELKTAASYSLGRLAVGNLEKFLPFLLKQISAQPKRQYLLLHSLKEVIGSESVDSRAMEFFRPRIEQICPVLMEHAMCAEEGTRNVVAECLGKLCLAYPEYLLPRLKECVKSDSPLLRATAVTAVKFLIVEHWTAVDDLLRVSMGDFLQTVKDPNHNVRRVALVTFNSAAHNKPNLIRDLLDELLPALYAETAVKKELVREVEMGPFKHMVDDGLDLRKAAFECMYTLLETCLERLSIPEFMTHVEAGLSDHHDIKLLTYLMLARLSVLCPTQVLQRLEKISEPLKMQMHEKVKPNAVKQESDKQDELRRAAIRLIIALQRIPEAYRQVHLVELLNVVRNNPELNSLYQEAE
uniref:TIP120 domain-containing protein n=1 Tax=Syphacia muris TaxID=451379 RepID=A0A0N5AZJ8_9BILA